MLDVALFRRIQNGKTAREDVLQFSKLQLWDLKMNTIEK